MTLTRGSRAGFATLQLTSDAAQFEVCPARGALLTSCRLEGDEVLFLDEASFADAAKNVRGGVPILFPIAGPAADDSAMKQHGFARTSSWAEVAASEARVVLLLVSSPATRAVFAHDFEVLFSLSLEGASVRCAWAIRNTGATAMPMQFGLHPYFRVPLEAKSAARVETDATLAFDNRARAFVAVTGTPKFDGDEVDLHLLNHGPDGTTLHRGALAPIRLEWSTSFHTLVTWTLPGQPFVCVEPWSAPALAARRGEALPSLGAGETAKFTLRIHR